jgi:hypothetical protein
VQPSFARRSVSPSSAALTLAAVRQSGCSSITRTRVPFQNLDRCLKAAGATWADVVKTNTFVTDFAATEIGSQMGGAALSESLGRQTFVTVLAAFALGYAAALLIHRAR